MGTNNSKTDKQHQIQHQIFQNAQVLTDDEVQIQVRTTLDDYNTWKSNLKKINFTNKENIMFPLNHSFQEEGWCSQNTGYAKITYDNYPFVFQQELQNRISLNKHLSQEEMWYLLYTLVTTAKDFSFVNKKVGDIRPHNIFVNSAGQIKLAVCFSWPNQPTNLQKTMNQKEVTYISPQQLEICKQNKIQNLINGIIAESFSIGLTMLHAGLLQNLSSIYNLEKCQINKKLLEQKIQNWMNLQFLDQNNQKLSYSFSLKEIVKNLCVFDQSSRQKSTEVFALLQPHKQAILNIEPFELNYKNEKNPIKNKQQSGHLQIAQTFVHPLQRSSGFGNYGYNEMPRIFPSTQTPVSMNPNYDWSTRTFSQVPVNKNQNNYSLQFFDKYANSANSPQKASDLNVRMANTVISQGQSVESRPLYNGQSSTVKQTTVFVRPFMSIDQQIQQNHLYKHQNNMTLEKQVQKKVQSNDFIQIAPLYQDKQPSNTNRFTPPTNTNKFAPPTNTNNLSSDFLKKIDQQIQKSKAMFPS